MPARCIRPNAQSEDFPLSRLRDFEKPSIQQDLKILQEYDLLPVMTDGRKRFGMADQLCRKWNITGNYLKSLLKRRKEESFKRPA